MFTSPLWIFYLTMSLSFCHSFVGSGLITLWIWKLSNRRYCNRKVLACIRSLNSLKPDDAYMNLNTNNIGGSSPVRHKAPTWTIVIWILKTNSNGIFLLRFRHLCWIKCTWKCLQNVDHLVSVSLCSRQCLSSGIIDYGLDKQRLTFCTDKTMLLILGLVIPYSFRNNDSTTTGLWIHKMEYIIRKKIPSRILICNWNGSPLNLMCKE